MYNPFYKAITRQLFAYNFQIHKTHKTYTPFYKLLVGNFLYITFNKDVAMKLQDSEPRCF